MKLGCINSRRPSKPNLPSAHKPYKLLAPIGVCRTLSSLTYQIPQSPIASTKMNWSLLNCFPSTKLPSYYYRYGKIRIWLNVPLNDMSIERVRVKEFVESNDEDCGWVNLVFLQGFSLKILSGSSLHFVGIRVFIVVYVRNVKSQFSSKQGILATQSCDWNELRVWVAS